MSIEEHNERVRQQVAARAARRAKLKAQIDGTVTAGELDVLWARSGNKRTGTTIGTTKHILGAAQKMGPKEPEEPAADLPD